MYFPPSDPHTWRLEWEVTGNIASYTPAAEGQAKIWAVSQIRVIFGIFYELTLLTALSTVRFQ